MQVEAGLWQRSVDTFQIVECAENMGVFAEMAFKGFPGTISNYCETSQKVGHLVTNHGSQTINK